MALATPGRLRASRPSCALAAGALLACSTLLQRGAEPDRPIPPTPTPLTIAAGAPPRGAAGGGYDGAGRILFDVFPGGQSPARIHESRFADDGSWSAAVPAIAGFDGWHASPQVAPGGARVYFESPRREPAVAGREDTDLWVAERVGGAWGKARPVGAPFDSPHNEHGPTISARGTLCINSNRRGITAGHDVLCARRVAAGWDAPVPLDGAVNGPSAEIAPFIDPDEKYLLFASNRAGGAGAFDLYVSVNRDGRWQPATPLGAPVNSAASENNPAVSPDGRRLLFSRTVGDRVVLHETRFDPRWIEGAR